MLLYLLSNKWNNENIFHFTSLEYFLSFKKAEIWAALLFFCKSSIRNNRAIFISCCFYSVGDQSWLVYFHRHKIIKNIIHSDDKYYAISYHLTSQSLFLLFVQEYKKKKVSFFLFLAEADFSLIPMEKVSICSSSSELISGRKVFMETFWWKLPDQESYENSTSVSSAGKILHHLDLIYLSILIHHYYNLIVFFFFFFAFQKFAL